MALPVDSATKQLSRLGIDDAFAYSVPNLKKNLHLLSPEQVELAKKLIEMGQSHLFEQWAKPGVDDNEKKPSLIRGYERFFL